MAIFQSDARVVLKRLSDKAYETSQERDQLLAQLDTVIAEGKGKPEAAVRAAAGTLFALRVPGTEQRLAELAVHGKGEPQEIVRRLLLDAPVTPALAPVLWHLSGLGRVEDRCAFLTRLAGVPIDPRRSPAGRSSPATPSAPSARRPSASSPPTTPRGTSTSSWNGCPRRLLDPAAQLTP